MDIPSPHAPGDDERTGTTAPLNDTERVWSAQHRALIAELCDGDVDAWTVGELFDRVHGTWLASDERPDPRPLVQAFGVALGDLVVRQVPALGWVSYRDDDDTELALASDDHPLVVFPLSSVDEHWGDVEAGWFSGHVHAVVDQSLQLLGLGVGPGADGAS